MAEAQKLSSEELAKLRAKLKSEAAKLAAGEGREPNKPDAEHDDGEGSKRIRVEIDSDNMSAVLCLSEPAENEQYTVPEVISALRSNRVVLGINSGLIMNIIRDRRYDEEIIVAEGKSPIPGTEGYYEWYIDLEKKTTPDIREDGSVDYTSMNKLANVAEGEKIAKYHPAVQGEKGYDVCGGERIPRIVKDQPRLRGKYIEYDEDTMEYTATLAGKISRNGTNIEILSVHEVNTDLDNTSGTVEFYGDIVINGNVDMGATIRAGRNVTITGVVAGGKVFAGGDVVIQKGAQSKSKISARGDIFAEFIEYANIDATGEIRANYIMNSEVRSNRKVLLDGNKASIIGGYTHGLEGVELRESGNYTEPRTELHAGFAPEEYQQFDILLKKEESTNEELKEIVAEISELLIKARDKGATPESKERIYELNVKKEAAHKTLDELSNEKRELIARMEAGTNAYIEIRGDVYRNTRIYIDAAKLMIEKEESFVRFVNKNDRIERRTPHTENSGGARGSNK